MTFTSSSLIFLARQRRTWINQLTKCNACEVWPILWYLATEFDLRFCFEIFSRLFFLFGKVFRRFSISTDIFSFQFYNYMLIKITLFCVQREPAVSNVWRWFSLRFTNSGGSRRVGDEACERFMGTVFSAQGSLCKYGRLHTLATAENWSRSDMFSHKYCSSPLHVAHRILTLKSSPEFSALERYLERLEVVHFWNITHFLNLNTLSNSFSPDCCSLERLLHFNFCHFFRFFRFTIFTLKYPIGFYV